MGDDRSLTLIKGAGPPDLDEVGPVQELEPDPEGEENRIAVGWHPAARCSDRQTYHDDFLRPQDQARQPFSWTILKARLRPVRRHARVAQRLALPVDGTLSVGRV